MRVEVFLASRSSANWSNPNSHRDLGFGDNDDDLDDDDDCGVSNGI